MLSIAAASTADFERSVAYNTLPWAYSIGKALLLGVAPTTQAPTLPDVWLSANGTAPPGLRNCQFVPGPGFIVVLHYASSPVGPYNELFASTGVFSCTCLSGDGRHARAAAATKPLPSLQRIWVDDDSPGGRAARAAGHRIWGIPKRVGAFEWRGGGADGRLGVQVRDVATGEVVLDVDTQQVQKGVVVPWGSHNNNGLQLLGWLPSFLAEAVHFPLDLSRNAGNASAALPGEVPAYAVAEEAARRGGLPIKAGIQLDLSTSSLVKLVVKRVSGAALMGPPGAKLVPLPLGLRVPQDTPTLLMPPQLLC